MLRIRHVSYSKIRFSRAFTSRVDMLWHGPSNALQVGFGHGSGPAERRLAFAQQQNLVETVEHIRGRLRDQSVACAIGMFIHKNRILVFISRLMSARFLL